MPCLNDYILKGINSDCRANIAGIRKLYITYYEAVHPVVDYDTHIISAYTIDAGTEWYEYEFAKGTASLTTNLTQDNTTGNRYYTNTITAAFNKLQAAEHVEMIALSGERLVAVVIDNNGTGWYVGLDRYLAVNNQEAGTGAAREDRNGYTITLDCISKWMPFKFTADIDDPTPIKVFGFTPDGRSISSDSGTVTTQLWIEGYELINLFGLDGEWYSTTTGTTEHGYSLAITYNANTGSSFRQAAPGAKGRNLDTQEEVYAYFMLSQSAPAGKYVQDLIDEGYARVITGASGNYVEILETNPYPAERILDLWEVAFNEKQLTEGVDNVIVWAQPASAIDPADIREAYDGQAMTFTPRGGLFWQDMGDSGSTDVFEVSFNGAAWIACDYPWGSYQSEGLFAPRYNANLEPYYAQQGFRNTPMKVKVNLNNFGSIGQVMFTQMKTTKELTINIIEGQYFGCHDVVGMFEADGELQTLNIIGDMKWEHIRTCLYMFDGCTKLTAIPYNTQYGREHTYNVLFPRFDGTRGTANVCRILNGCSALTYFGPTFNMSAISRSGCTWDGYSQDPTTEMIFDCPVLTDIQIKGLGHNSWNFTDNSTGTYIPLMSASSIDYLLINVQQVSGLTLTLPAAARSQVTSGYIELAQGKGWTVNWA